MLTGHNTSSSFIRLTSLLSGLPLLRNSCVQISHENKKETTKKTLGPVTLEEIYNISDEFDINGLIPIVDCYVEKDGVQSSQRDINVWDIDVINLYRSRPNTCGGYFASQCEMLCTTYADVIKGKHGAVFGSQSPWAEAALLNAGAKKITTVEYQNISSSHPGKVRTLIIVCISEKKSR